MDIVIQKFGGTSVSSKENRKLVIGKVKAAISQGQTPVVVVSAMGRKGDPFSTDTLLGLVDEAFTRHNPGAVDLLMGCGEIISTVVLAKELYEEGIVAEPFTGGQAGIITDKKHMDATTIRTESDNILNAISNGIVPVVAGFQGKDEDGFLTTLGRGGSDTTACILGASLGADAIEIYTDVDGIMTADPNVVETAGLLDEVDYFEIVQFAKQGAKVIHPVAVEIAMRANILLRIKNTFSMAEGTVIRNRDFINSSNRMITGITSTNNRVQVRTNHCQKIFGKFLKTLSLAKVNIDLVDISVGEQVFTVHSGDIETVGAIADNMDIIYSTTENCAKISIIGGAMHNVPGVFSKILDALLENDIDVLQTADSNSTIWCLVHGSESRKAINVLHEILI